MKRWNMLLLALLLLCVPAAGSAQDLPELFTQMMESVGEGLAQGAQMAQDAAQQELTLSMALSSERVEEGKSVTLTLTAGNPLPQETKVSFALNLPERLKASGETAWEAVLPAAQMDAQTGELVPSVTQFTREMTLEQGGGSEQAAITCEMAMGTRFYRAAGTLDLCVPDVSVSAQLSGMQGDRLQPGDAFAYEIVLINSGDAPKDVALEMTLPACMALEGELEEGFACAGQVIRGSVHVPAARKTIVGMTDAEKRIVIPVRAAQDALEGDADAQRLAAAALRADGERVAVPRVQVCGAKISARLMADTQSIETGEETMLSVVVVNGGLAAADVQLSCVLPRGLTLRTEEEREESDEGKPVVADGGDDLPGAGEAIPVQAAQPAMRQEDRTLMFDLHMAAAKETADGVIAHTEIIEIPVRAQMTQENLTEELLGASLSWRVNDAEETLGEAVALRVHGAEVLGLSRPEWNGLFWSGVLLLALIVCLYAALHKEKREEEYCFE